MQHVLGAELVTSVAAKQTFTAEAFVAPTAEADVSLDEGAPRRLRSLRLSASRPARLRVAQRLGKQLPGSGNASVTRPARREARRDGSSSLPSHLHNLLRRDLSTAGFTGFLPNPDALDEPMVDEPMVDEPMVDEPMVDEPLPADLADAGDSTVAETAVAEVILPEAAALEVAVSDVTTDVAVAPVEVTDARREAVVLRALPVPNPAAFPIVHVKAALPARCESSLLQALRAADKPAAIPAAPSSATPSAVVANPVVVRGSVEKSRRIHTGETCKYCRRQYALNWLACPTCGALAMSARPRRRKPPTVTTVAAERVAANHAASASVTRQAPPRVVRPQRPVAPRVEIDAADRSALWTYVIGGVILVVIVLFFLGVI
ncbi:MAG: hypothetical protein H6832_04120 [Planctomycetes bacterium]|nr:hypothetical protein [Planctomycetota bacterium]